MGCAITTELVDVSVFRDNRPQLNLRLHSFLSTALLVWHIMRNLSMMKSYLVRVTRSQHLGVLPRY